jgi:hypothetical protein
MSVALSLAAQWPCVAPRKRLLPLVPVVLGLLVTGCQNLAPHNSPPVPVRTAAHASSEVAEVQSPPLYLQARQACKHRDYRHAASLLQKLAQTPGLAPDALAFCTTQRNICLKDAGLPVAAPVAASAVSARPAQDADCGPRALLLVCQKLGVKTSLQTLQQTAGTTAQGTTLAGLQQAARKLGLQAEGVQVSRDALPNTSLPALAWINRNHYVALLALSGSGDAATATIQDPNKAGEETLSQEQLLLRCGGYLLLIHR